MSEEPLRPSQNQSEPVRACQSLPTDLGRLATLMHSVCEALLGGSETHRRETLADSDMLGQALADSEIPS